MKEINFCDIDGIKLGHAQNLEAGTGCTVILCKDGGTGGVDVRGGAPGTRETDLLNPVNLVDKVHGIVLSGGSAFGLDACSGVMQFLEEENVGYDVGFSKVPIVLGAVLFDLGCGDSKVRPDKKMGYDACVNSITYNDDLNGNIGAGTGATVGKMISQSLSMKGGLGSYAIKIDDLYIGAIVAVNCLGDVIDPNTNQIIAGALTDDKKNLQSTYDYLLQNLKNDKTVFNGNTTIGTIVTNADLTKAQATKISSMAHSAYSKTMIPSHTMYDGDTIFTLSTNKIKVDINILGMLATKVMENAILRGVKSCDSAYGYISHKELFKNK